MTEATLSKLMRMGFGSGRLDQYQPWIRVRRSFSSPISNLHVTQAVGQGRGIHLLSGLEQVVCLLASYLGAKEIREQFPIPTARHTHPGFDPSGRLSTQDSERAMPSLIEIAEEVRVNPGTYPGTKIPFVATTDLVLLVAHENVNRLVFWPIKSHSDLDGPGAPRRRERLQLEKKRADFAGGHFQLITDKTVGQTFMDNLRGYRPAGSDWRRFHDSSEVFRFAEAFDACQETTLLDAVRDAGVRAGLSDIHEMRGMFEVALWEGLLDVSLSETLQMDLPYSRGGRVTRQKLQQHLLGGFHA